MDASVPAEIEIVYRALDGGIHHARCSQRMVIEARSREELRFYCITCSESVRLLPSLLSRIPVAT